jgi:hypothetical protein
MRFAFAIAGLVALAAGAGARGETPADHACRDPLPHGPNIPAPLIMWDSCGTFRLGTDGHVVRLRRHWLAYHGSGTGRRFGAKLRLRRTRDGAYVIQRDGRTIWRSSGLYPNDYTGVAFGPGLFAFGSYTHRGIFLTDLRSPEQLVARGRGVFPLDFTRTGNLLVVGRREVTVIGSDGRPLRRFKFGRGYGFDATTDALYLVTPQGMLAEVRGTELHLLRPAPHIAGNPIPLSPGLLAWYGTHALVLTDRSGVEVASAHWNAALGTDDFGVSPSADGELFAYRLSHRKRDATRGVATVFVLRRGDHGGQFLLRHEIGPMGCGIPGGFDWHDHDFLYDFGDGRIEIVEPESREKTGLTRLARSLPRRAPGEPVGVAWDSSFHP